MASRPLQRHALGLFALLLLIAGFVGLGLYGVGESRASMASSMCLRIGMVLGSIWLAFPQLLQLSGKASPWTVGTLVLFGGLLIARPKLIVVLGPLLLVMGVLYGIGWILNPPPREK